MQQVMSNLKFDIGTGNAAMQIMNSGFVPNGEAKKNGWEEVRDIGDTIKKAVVELYTLVMATARDCIALGAGNEQLILNLYKSTPQDVQITTNTLLAIDAKFAGKTGFFRTPEDSMEAQALVIEYNNAFENVRVLVSTTMVELTDIHNRYKKQAEQLAAQAAADAANPAVITDVEVKAV